MSTSAVNDEAANPVLASVLARIRRASEPADAAEQKLELRLEGWPKRVVVSALSVAGDPSRPNEDAYAVVPFADSLRVGVFDGTTGLRPIPALDGHGVTGAQLAAGFLRLSAETAPPGVAPAELLRESNRRLRHLNAQLPGLDAADASAVPASSATVALLDGRSRQMQLAHVYDSWCIAYRADGSSLLLTDDLNRRYDAESLEVMARAAAERGVAPRQARHDPSVEEALIALRLAGHNRADGAGVGVVNGDPDIERYIQQRTVGLEGLAAILMGTDGLLPPGWAVEDEAARRRLYELVGTGGLKALVEAKRRIEDADPDWHQLRFKHSDDATGIFVRFD